MAEAEFVSRGDFCAVTLGADREQLPSGAVAQLGPGRLGQLRAEPPVSLAGHVPVPPCSPEHLQDPRDALQGAPGWIR